MDNLRNKQVLAAMILFSVCMVTYAEQGEKTESELQFITSSEQVELGSSDEEWPEHIVSKPKYIVAIKFAKPIVFPSRLRNTMAAGLFAGGTLNSSVLIDDSISEKQLRFLFLTQSPINPRDTFTELDFWANSEQEARELTNDFIELCDKEVFENLEAHKKELEENRDIIAEAEKNLPESETELKDLEILLGEKVKEYAKNNYSTEDEDSVYSLAKKHVEELANFLRTVDFELAGLDAKIESINKYKKSDMIIDDETLIKLNQILMTTDIERAGALARKEAYKSAFDLAKELYNLFERRSVLYRLIDRRRNNLAKAKRELPGLERKSENLPVEMQPVEIEDNKVVIYPVRQD